MLNPDRLFPADAVTRAIARCLYAEVAGLPILSPHGHTNPQWFADGREIWRVFARHYHLFRGTSTRAWLEHTLGTLFELDAPLATDNADAYYDVILEHSDVPTRLRGGPRSCDLRRESG